MEQTIGEEFLDHNYDLQWDVIVENGVTKVQLVVIDTEHDTIAHIFPFQDPPSFTTVGFEITTDWDQLIFSRVVVTEVHTAIPEPSTYLLFATGLLGLLAYGWRRKQHAA